VLPDGNEVRLDHLRVEDVVAACEEEPRTTGEPGEYGTTEFNLRSHVVYVDRDPQGRTIGVGVMTHKAATE